MLAKFANKTIMTNKNVLVNTNFLFIRILKLIFRKKYFLYLEAGEGGGGFWKPFIEKYFHWEIQCPTSHSYKDEF